jgi:hypothetical protein
MPDYVSAAENMTEWGRRKKLTSRACRPLAGPIVRSLVCTANADADAWLAPQALAVACRGKVDPSAAFQVQIPR